MTLITGHTNLSRKQKHQLSVLNKRRYLKIFRLHFLAHVCTKVYITGTNAIATIKKCAEGKYETLLNKRRKDFRNKNDDDIDDDVGDNST